MISGILLGLAAATCQSCSYIFSRMFAGRYSGSTLSFLVLSHGIMGVLSAVGLVVVWPGVVWPGERMPAFATYWWPLVSATFFYLTGQVGLFLALRRTDASRVSPLLGLKLLILALISITFLGKSYSAAQWCAVGLTLLAAALLNRSGGGIPWRSLAWILFACFGYSLSDLGIKALVDRLSVLGLVRGSLVSTFMSYVICGAGALVMLCVHHRPPRRMWLHAVPFSIAWLSAMMFLFACFGNIGVVFGNIVQSTRGVISIGLGAVIAHAGYVHLEQKVGGWVLARRVLAALLMVGAIALFSLSRSGG
jgi:drug/metabolite transporter (DMT)-like permease